MMPRNKYQQEALQKYIDELPYRIDGAFMSAHGNPWKKLNEMIESRYNLKNINMKVIMQSVLRMYIRKSRNTHQALIIQFIDI